jgi:hypothetical protein
MFRMTVGHSIDVDEEDAVAEALARCGEGVGGVGAVLVFASVDKDYVAILRRVRDALGDVPLLGCTTDGELASSGSFEEDSLVIATLTADRVRFATGVGEGSKRAPLQAAADAVDQALGQLDGEPSLCIAFSNALGSSGALVLDGLRRRLGDDVPVVGGVAADQWRFERTQQFCDDRVFDDAVVVMLLGGPIAFAHGVCSGWTPIGQAGRVTAVEGNQVLTIDDAPAIEFYRRYLGDHADPSSEYPLAVYPEDDERFRLLTAVSYAPSTGSVKLASPVEEGGRVRVTQATRDDILGAADSSIVQAMDELAFEPRGALFVSCAARKQILGTRCREEVARLRRRLGDGVPFLGLYAYGEISPLRRGGPTEYHTESLVSLILGEAS